MSNLESIFKGSRLTGDQWETLQVFVDQLRAEDPAALAILTLINEISWRMDRSPSTTNGGLGKSVPRGSSEQGGTFARDLGQRPQSQACLATAQALGPLQYPLEAR